MQENPYLAHNIFNLDSNLRGYPSGYSLLLSTALSVTGLKKALTWIDESRYLDQQIFLVRAIILSRNSELSATAFGQFHFRYGSVNRDYAI